jgi:hypothetical protein
MHSLGMFSFVDFIPKLSHPSSSDLMKSKAIIHALKPVFWIRIPNQDPDPGRPKLSPKKEKNEEILC